MNPDDFELPEGVDPATLKPDPSRRPGCWITPEGDVYACPVGWKPKAKPTRATKAKDELKDEGAETPPESTEES